MRRTLFFCFFLVSLVSAGADSLVRERPVVAVLELRVKELERDSMLFYVDSLSGALFRTGRVDVVDRSRRDASLEEIEFSASAAADAKAQLEVGRQLAATHIVSGSLGRYGADYVASLKLVETATAKMVGSVEEVYKDFDGMISHADDMAAALMRSASIPRRESSPPAPARTEAARPIPAPGIADSAAGSSAGSPGDDATPGQTGVDPVDALLESSGPPAWTPFQLSLWAPLQTFPVASRVVGLRLGFGYSHNVEVTGIDAGIVNVVTGTMSGFEVGIFNRVGKVFGVQTGIVGIAERVDIAQANIVYNRTGVLVGTQIGIVNLADKCVGTQIGIVNVAGLLKGVQIGIVNIVRYGDWAGFMPFLNFRL